MIDIKGKEKRSKTYKFSEILFVKWIDFILVKVPLKNISFVLNVFWIGHCLVLQLGPDFGLWETISASPYGATYGSLSLIQNINRLSSW